MLTHIGEIRMSLFSPLIQMLTSENTLTNVTRINILSAIWAFSSQSNWHIKLTLTHRMYLILPTNLTSHVKSWQPQKIVLTGNWALAYPQISSSQKKSKCSAYISFFVQFSYSEPLNILGNKRSYSQTQVPRCQLRANLVACLSKDSSQAWYVNCFLHMRSQRRNYKKKLKIYLITW
jgi:hypothetical protein